VSDAPCPRPGHDHLARDCPDEDEATGDLLEENDLSDEELLARWDEAKEDSGAGGS